MFGGKYGRVAFINCKRMKRPRKVLGTLRSDDSDGNEDVKKAVGLITKTTILHVHHTFLYISLPSLHDYDVVAAGPRTCLNHIEGLERLRRENASFQSLQRKYKSDDEISSLFLNLDKVLRNSILGGFTYI